MRRNEFINLLVGRSVLQGGVITEQRTAWALKIGVDPGAEACHMPTQSSAIWTHQYMHPSFL